ncbi:MAG: hypothetical protein MJK12_16410 [Colwellia sp.]|nr:hypothetical protein [Colwellia sp.]
MKILLLILGLVTAANASATELLTLANEKIKVTVAPEQGGELSGFEVKLGEDFHQLLYRANDYKKQKGWRGKSLFLWPATGPTKKTHQLANKYAPGHYTVQGKNYAMPFHGFAGKKAWQVVSQNEKTIKLRLESDDNTRKYYPFDFELFITYTLLENGVALFHEVKSSEKNTSAMPFSIGNHATFKAPLINGSKLDDFKFSTTCNKQMEYDQNNMPTGTTINTSFNGINLFNQLPERNAIPLTDCQKDKKLSLIDPSGLTITVAQHSSQTPSMPYVEYNLWASQDLGFISPEPWIGAKNSLNSGIGLISLESNGHWTWTVTITAED